MCARDCVRAGRSGLVLTLELHYSQRRGQGGGRLGRAKPSQPLKLAPPPKHDGRSSATYELPQKIFAYWRFNHSRADAAISGTLALLNSAGTNFINYLLKVKVRAE